jgi:GAF domain-containing protein
MYAPLMVGKEIKGMLGVANLIRRMLTANPICAFTTLANSMSVALENARLFDETEQRAAELQIINSVQEGPNQTGYTGHL